MTIDTREFNYVRSMVVKSIANDLPTKKRYLVNSRLTSAARVEGFDSPQAMLTEAQRRPGGPAEKAIIEAMTTNETLFFRDVHPFQALAGEIIPEILEQRRRERNLRIWSAACATGQEPYSVAMMLAQSFPWVLHEWRVDIVATDVSRQVLARARRGWYSDLEIHRGLSDSLRAQYFRPVDGGWQLDDALRQRVRFQPHNLARDGLPWTSLDVVMLRNVLIYFDAPTRAAVLERVSRAMAPHGVVIAGSSENLAAHCDRLSARTSGRTRFFVRNDDRSHWTSNLDRSSPSPTPRRK